MQPQCPRAGKGRQCGGDVSADREPEDERERDQLERDRLLYPPRRFSRRRPLPLGALVP